MILCVKNILGDRGEGGNNVMFTQGPTNRMAPSLRKKRYLQKKIPE